MTKHATMIGRNAFVTTCRGCGCDDAHACIDDRGRPCRWVLLDIDAPSGVCSACADAVHWHPGLLADMGFVDAEEDAA